MNIEQTIRQYLPQIVHMSLATSNNGKPWVCEVHFAYDDELNLYFRSLTSRRHSQDIAQNPAVAGNIITQHFLGQKVRGVYFEGTAALLSDANDKQRAYKAISQRLHVGQEILEDADKPEGHQFYQINVENYYLFDSYTSQPSQKYKLAWKQP